MNANMRAVLCAPTTLITKQRTSCVHSNMGAVSYTQQATLITNKYHVHNNTSLLPSIMCTTTLANYKATCVNELQSSNMHARQHAHSRPRTTIFPTSDRLLFFPRPTTNIFPRPVTDLYFPPTNHQHFSPTNH